MDFNKFKAERPRRSVEINISCWADDRMFVREFTDMPKEMQDAFSEGGLSIPCQGGGVVGQWCCDCFFACISETETL